MYWHVRAVEAVEEDASEATQGRFVLHRHHDERGAHLDLRLEQPGGFLLGWRFDTPELSEGAWGEEKPPHPLHWLEQQGDAVCVDRGVYRWTTHDAAGGSLVLCGEQGTRVLHLQRASALPAHVVGAVLDYLREQRMSPEVIPNLLKDGWTARQRAMARLVGLGRELDGETFAETLWRATLETRSLDEIHQHLAGFERRFDERYPPRPYSRPDYDASAGAAREKQARDLLRDFSGISKEPRV